MQTILIVLSGVITIVAAVPYIIQILRGKTKPRVVSWFTWTLLTAIACAASFSDGQMATGILLACATAEVLAIVVLGIIKQGDRGLEPLDIVCQVGALAGLVLWLVFNSPSVAVIATVTIDAIGVIPTFKHSWLKPHEETWSTFALSSLGGFCTVLAVDQWVVTAVAYPLYIVIANLFLAVVIFWSPHRPLKGEPAELRQL